jgi:CBS domain-containing protein
MMDGGIGAREVHAVLTLLGDAITRQLIDLVTRELHDEGIELPAEGWCWLGFGSQARREHALGSDQDNGLVLADELDASELRFRVFSERVCAGLDACGYAFCRGGIMASQDACRKSLAAWTKDFRGWIRNPGAEAVMRSGIFFDMRAVSGQAELATTLQARVLDAVAERPLFVAHVVRDALERRPPLGFFRQLVVEPGGEHAETLDIKHRGVAPIVDLARIHALESRCTEPETLRRLGWARDHGLLSDGDFVELDEALRVLQRERLWHHVRCVKARRPIDDHLRPADLSGVERRQLRDAFRVLQTAQKGLETGHQLENLGR